MSPAFSIRLLATQSDARLVELARQGHERAFEALVQRYRRPLLGYCRRLLCGEGRAEDALQQGLLGAWLALQRGVEVREARPWLYRIVHNAALNLVRSGGDDHAELSESLAAADASEAVLERRMAVREMLAGLASLPEMQRVALLQIAVEGHSHEVAAASLGLSEGALRGLVYRARASLRAAATAVIPGPLVNWAAGSAAGGDGVGVGLTELSVGGGSAGLGGLLLKSGAVVLSTGVLAGGFAGHVHSRHTGRHGRPASLVHRSATARHAAVRPNATIKVPALVPPRPVGVSKHTRVKADGGHRSGRDRVDREHRVLDHHKGGPERTVASSGGGGDPGLSAGSGGGPGPSSGGGGPGPSAGSGGAGLSSGGGGPGPSVSGGQNDSDSTSGSSGKGKGDGTDENSVVGGDLLRQEGKGEDHEDAHHDQ